VKTPKSSSNAAKFLSCLIRTAYLPDEVPPAVTTRHFARYCETQFGSLKAQQGDLLKRTTNYDTFTAPRTNSGRRNLAIVHPISQLAISLLITQHQREIRKAITKNGVSLYRTQSDLTNERAFLGLDFEKRRVPVSEAFSKSQYVLQADISRFFYTAYTHSIPWAIIGKEKVKDWLVNHKKKLSSHWSNDFDRALQGCQSRETFGIPVGPDTSRIIAEMILSGVETDKELSHWLKDRPAFRLMDDYTIGFDDETSARKALAALRSALWKFNLQLNEEKTTVVHSRTPTRERWKLDFEAISTSAKKKETQEQQIYRLVELSLHFCQDAKSDTPAMWACRRLSNLKKVDDNLPVILDALFRLSREFPRCTSYVAGFLINHQDKCKAGAVRSRIVKWIRATLKANQVHSNDFEISWCLVICGVLEIKITKDDLHVGEGMPSAIVFAILGLLHGRGLLEQPLSTWPWRKELKKSGLCGQYWLPFYEAILRGWTKDKTMVAAVNSDPVLSKMLTAKITFLEDRLLEAAKISISRRVFSPNKPLEPKQQPHTGPFEIAQKLLELSQEEGIDDDEVSWGFGSIPSQDIEYD